MFRFTSTSNSLGWGYICRNAHCSYSCNEKNTQIVACRISCEQFQAPSVLDCFKTIYYPMSTSLSPVLICADPVASEYCWLQCFVFMVRDLPEVLDAAHFSVPLPVRTEGGFHHPRLDWYDNKHTMKEVCFRTQWNWIPLLIHRMEETFNSYITAKYPLNYMWPIIWPYA